MVRRSHSQPILVGTTPKTALRATQWASRETRVSPHSAGPRYLFLLLGVLLTLAPASRASILSHLLASKSASPRFLPAARAYRLHARRLSDHRIVLRWRIAKGYYLYRNKTRVEASAPPGVHLRFRLPPGLLRNEPQGPVPVYYRHLVLTIRALGSGGQPVVLRVHYQGCAERGLCYPPQERTLTLPSPHGLPPAPSQPFSTAAQARAGQDRTAAPAAPTLRAPEPASRRAAPRTQGGSLGGEILLFFLAGILLAFTPCGAPMVPILLGTLGRAGGGTRLGRFRASVAYVLGVAITYGLLGLLAAAAGQSLIPFFETPWVIGIFAALFALYGTAMLADLRLELPLRLRDRISRLGSRNTSPLLAPLLLGVGSALLASPCLTPAVAAGLTLAVYQGEAIRGALLLFVLGLGLGIPLLSAALLASSFWPRAGAWLTAVERFLGFVLYGLALWFAARVLPTPVVAFLLGLLFALMAVFVNPGATVPDEPPGRRFRRGFAVVLLLLAVGEVFGALGGTRHLVTPLRFVAGSSVPRPTTHEVAPKTLIARSPHALDRDLALARREGRSVLVDYDARWCVSCAIMDRTVFPRRRVVAALRPFLFVRADVTRDNRASTQLLARYHVLGPPTFLYFAFRHGALAARPTARLVGAQDAAGFLAWLTQLKPRPSSGGRLLPTPSK